MRARELLAAALLVAAPAAADGPLTLPRALELARHGPAVAAAEAVVERAATGRELAASARRPHLEATLADRFLASDPGFTIPRGALGNPVELGLVAGERHVWTAAVTVRQMLWDAGRTSALLEAAGHAEAAARARRDAVRRALDLGTLEAFRADWTAQQLVVVAEHAVREYRALLDQVRSLVEAEQLPLADELQARAALAAARGELAEVRAARRRALAALEELVGQRVEAVAPLPPGDGADTPPEAERIERALAAREELAALTARAAALEARARAAAAGTRPALVAEASAQRVDDRYLLHEDNASVAVALTLPLLDGGRSRARAAELRAAAREARAQLEAARRRVRREVRDAVAALEAARERLAAARAGRDAAEEALRQARLRYREELITNRELLDAEADAIRARRALAVARADLAAARLALEAVSGGDLLARLGAPDTTTEDTRDE